MGAEEARALGLDFVFVTVTTESYLDQGRYQQLGLASDARWRFCNWQFFPRLLEDTDEAGNPMAADLLALFYRRGLRPFRGFGELAKIRPSVAPDRLFFNDIDAPTRDRFLGFCQVLGALPRLQPGLRFSLASTPQRFQLPSTQLKRTDTIFWDET